MIIPKIANLDVTDAAAVERALAGLQPQAIACCNWPQSYPYAPDVEFRLFHTGAYLVVRFDVREGYTAALVAEDNGRVWTDSCAELFIAVDDKSYYNFETTCIGRMLLAHHLSREQAQPASPEVLRSVLRTTSLPGATFAEKQGDNRWSLTLAIPPTALFRHQLTDWSGVQARANLYKCGDNLSHPHFLSWQPVKVAKPDFHRPDFFGEIKFAK